jgi:AcrR family transcriptional regulator
MESNRLARKNIIVDAAEKVFAEKPFTKVSMRDIAKEAGISPALIYRHFPDQQHLFVEAFLRGTKRLIEQFTDLLSRDEKPQVEDAADIFIAYLTDHDQYFKMMTHFMLEGTIHEGLLDKLNSIERSMLDQFVRLFEKYRGKAQCQDDLTLFLCRLERYPHHLQAASGKEPP